jgi:hypothetical protein
LSVVGEDTNECGGLDETGLREGPPGGRAESMAADRIRPRVTTGICDERESEIGSGLDEAAVEGWTRGDKGKAGGEWTLSGFARTQRER